MLELREGSLNEEEGPAPAENRERTRRVQVCMPHSQVVGGQRKEGKLGRRRQSEIDVSTVGRTSSKGG